MIVDVHTHCWRVTEHMGEGFLQEARIARSSPVALDVRFDAFMGAAEPCDRVVVFGLKARHCGLYVPNDFVAEFVGRAPEKLVGFMSLDPHDADWLDDLRRSHEELGLAGIKLAPVYAAFDPLDRSLDPLFAEAQRRRLPIVFHMGTTFVRDAPLRYARPFLIDELATRWPELKIVLAHLAHPWEPECLVVIRKHPNVYADVAALYYRPWQFYNSMVLAGEYGLYHKLLFGTDYPFTTAAESIAALRHINHLVDGTPLPKVPSDAVEDIIHRDSLAILLGSEKQG